MQFVADNFTVFLIGLVVMWILQFGLAYFQMRRFYRRMIELKRAGLTAVGMCGNQYKGRAYAVLTIDENNRIVQAERFAGWTVFANLKPVPELIGWGLDEILASETRLPVSKKLQTAFTNAAKDLKLAREKQLTAPENQLANTLQFA
jgi:DNA-binding transcriptional regulator of glucitol operon